MIMIPLPSTRDLALIPPAPASLDQMTTLLLLILGAAVQSDQKQEVGISVLYPDPDLIRVQMDQQKRKK
jgi:hypothetical protein